MICIVAEITKLDGSIFVVDNKNLLSLEMSIEDRADVELPSWGVISNSGNVSFIDAYGDIKTLANQNMLKSGMNVTIRLKNTVSNFEEIILGFSTSDWNYDTENKKVYVSFKDGIEEWQEIIFEEIIYDFSGIERNFAWLYNLLYDATTSNPKYKMKKFDELDEMTRERLSKLYLQYPFVEQGNLWSQWVKFCEATQTHIFKGKDGIITCRYLGGN